MGNRSENFYQLWILGFAEIAKSLYEAAHGTKESFLWTETQERAFKTIKEALVMAPTPVLPDINRPFQLSRDERASVAKGES